MIIGQVVGTVISRQRVDRVDRPTYLLIEQSDQGGNGKQKYLVALDLIGAGRGELVLLCQGSSARQTPVTDDRPIDAVVVAIIDLIDEMGDVTYRK